MKEKTLKTNSTKQIKLSPINIKLPSRLPLGRHKIQAVKFGIATIDIFALVGVTDTWLEGVVRRQQNPEGLGMGFCPDDCPRGCHTKWIQIGGTRTDGSKWQGSVCVCLCD